MSGNGPKTKAPIIRETIVSILPRTTFVRSPQTRSNCGKNLIHFNQFLFK